MVAQSGVALFKLDLASCVAMSMCYVCLTFMLMLMHFRHITEWYTRLYGNIRVVIVIAKYWMCYRS